MIKRAIYLLTVLFASAALTAQTFNFEESTIPSDWTAVSGGSLTLSNNHYKEGVQSLCWETTGEAVLTVTFPSFTASTGNSAFLQIYTAEPTNDTLVVEFLNNASVRRTANYLLNYTGWREFNRAYTEYASKLSFTATSVRMSLKSTTASPKKIYFDKVRFNQGTEANRITGSQWLLDKDYFIGNATLINLYANPVDIAVEAPTSDELLALTTLQNKFKRTPAAGNVTNLNAAKSFANGFEITRNSDGTVKGNVVDMSAAALTTAVVTDYATKLELLAAEGLKDAPTLDLFRDLLDHLMDQGFGEGLSFIIKSNDYTTSRNIPSKLLNLLPACTSEQQDEVLQLVRWISYYGMLYEPEASYLSSLNSDVLYLYLPHMMGIALFQLKDANAVRELKALKRFLDRNTEYVPGGGDILKPDGTGFHHKTHYNNYMYSYRTWAETMYALSGTPFRIEETSYQRFKKAVIAVYTMATLHNGDTRYFANSLSGRNPFSSGMQLQFNKSLLEQLIEVGNDCMGAPDTELTAAYNYFYNSNKYPVTAKSYEGFHQFNYSPIGIYRKDNWVATMRAPTTNFFGAEIYSGANRFGRYQSHGSLDIMYSGSLAASGLPGNGTGGGWDWNVIPGTTTVHYTSWKEMMPNKNTTDRFDQYTKTKNFAGALSWGDCGMFAADFDQLDTWGSQRFTPTNLVFRKSVFAFDDIIISLGSGIGSSGIYSTSMITATNLFQDMTSSVSGSLVLNGNEITLPNSSTISTAQDNWMISPQGTGYFIPKGNDGIELRYGAQSTPKESGSDYASPATTANAAKAFINHGVKPSGKSYSFVIIPGTNVEQMQQKAAQMANNGGSIYEIHSQSGNLHALTYKPRNITAYTFFGSIFNLNFGIVKSSLSEHLLMHRPDETTGRQYFAAANPNLKPKSDAVFGWRSSTSQTTLTLNGEWLALDEVAGVQFHAPSNGETQLTITFTDGEPIYFALKRPDDTMVNNPTEADWVNFTIKDSIINLTPGEMIANGLNVTLFSVMGQLMKQYHFLDSSETIQLPTDGFMPGVYCCHVASSRGTQTFKWTQIK